MQCPTCRAEAAPNSTFCSHCGARLDTDERPAGAAEKGAADKKPAEPARGAAQPRGVAERLARTMAGAQKGASEVADETIWEGGYSAKAMIPAFLGAGVLSLALIVVSILFPPAFWIMLAIPVVWAYVLGLMAYRKLGVSYKLTTFRFFHETGILRRTIDRIEVIDMDDITVVQGVIERMLNVGQVRVSSSDRSHPQLILQGIDNPRDIAARIDQARRAERARRGLHIEMV